MQFSRSASCWLMGLAVSVSGLGCAAFDAAVTRHNGDEPPNTERLTAIARVFENQGHLYKAESMYRLAVRHDPHNTFAKERAEYIASLGKSRSFSVDEVQSAMAVADSHPAAVTTPPETLVTSTEKATATEQAVVEQDVVENTHPVRSVSAAAEDLFASVEQTINRVEADSFPVEEEPGIDDVFAGTDTEDSDFINLIEDDALTFEESVATDTADTVPDTSAFDLIEEAADEVVAEAAVTDEAVVADEVTFEQLSQWVDSPAQHTDELVSALKIGEDTGVRSLAAALLAECPGEQQDINLALENACSGADSLLRVTVRDSLARRGALKSDGVNDLLSLMRDTDPEIRRQASVTVRYCVNTEFSNECINQLIAMLEDEDASVRGMAAATLGDFGTEASVATQPLRDALSAETNEDATSAIESALERVDSNSPAIDTSSTTNSKLLPIVES